MQRFSIGALAEMAIEARIQEIEADHPRKAAFLSKYRTEIERVCRDFIDHACQRVVVGDEVSLRGLGTIKTVERRVKVRPGSPEMTNMPVIKFVPSTRLKAELRS